MGRIPIEDRRVSIVAGVELNSPYRCANGKAEWIRLSKTASNQEMEIPANSQVDSAAQTGGWAYTYGRRGIHVNKH